MPEKSVNYEIFTLSWLAFLSLLGGTVQYIRKLNNGQITKFSISEFIGDLTISGFVGFLSFLLCDMYDIDLRMTGVLIGMTSYMGSRAIFLLEFHLKKKYGISTDDVPDVDILKLHEQVQILTELMKDKDNVGN